MALRRARPLTFRPKGLSDAIDGTNAFPGAMQSLANLVPSPGTKNVFVPRPASVQKTDFTGLDGNTKQIPTALLVVGSIAYGMIPETTGPYAGKDVPFAYNVSTNTYRTISIPGGAAALPTSPPATGDWTPPIMAQVGNKIVITHPGFAGGAGPYFGWLDVSGFTDATHTGNTHSSTLIDTLSANVLQAGWTVGMTISGTGIPANTTIVSIATNGLSLTLSQAATSTNAGVTLTVAGGTLAAPLWASGNTNGAIQLSAVPLGVAQFNGRAWFAVGSGVVFTDSGNAVQVTNATQALTFSNGLTVTAVAGLPLSSPISGGMIQALIAFQGCAGMFQITGDSATTNLATNALNVGTGTLSPLSITPTPIGLAFVAPDGLRVIGFDAQVSEPIGAAGDGISLAFINSNHPSRTCAAFNQSTLRISVEDSIGGNTVTQEYWLHFEEKAWSGPHTFPAALIQPLQTTGNTFLMAGAGVASALWQSDVLPTQSSIYIENGAQLQWTYWPSLMPDTQEMAQNAMVETLLACSLATGVNIQIQALDELGNILDFVLLMGSALGPTVWGSFNWGGATWLGGSAPLQEYRLDWHQPIVFKQMSLKLTGPSQPNLALGNIYLKYQQLGYLIQRAS